MQAASEFALALTPRRNLITLVCTMGRERYRTSDEDVAEEFGRVMELLVKAQAKPRFYEFMAEGSSLGLTWVDALEYAVKLPQNGS